MLQISFTFHKHDCFGQIQQCAKHLKCVDKHRPMTTYATLCSVLIHQRYKAPMQQLFQWNSLRGDKWDLFCWLCPCCQGGGCRSPWAVLLHPSGWSFPTVPWLQIRIFSTLQSVRIGFPSAEIVFRS